MDQSIFFTTVAQTAAQTNTLCAQRLERDAQGALGAALVEAAWCAWPLPNLARSFWHCHGPDCSRVCLACLGLCRQAPQLAIAQLHLQMLCTGMHEQPAGEMLAKSGGFCRRSAPRARGRGSSHVPVWPGAPPPSPHSTALSTAKAVYKSNRGCHHVPRRRHINLSVEHHV